MFGLIALLVLQVIQKRMQKMVFPSNKKHHVLITYLGDVGFIHLDSAKKRHLPEENA